MGYGFVADDDKLNDLCSEFEKASAEIESYIVDIYKKIDDLNDVWSGDSYDAFKTRCDVFKKDLEELPDILDAFATEMGDLALDTDTLITCIKSLLDITNYTSSSFSGRSVDENGVLIADKGTYDNLLEIKDETDFFPNIFTSYHDYMNNLFREVSDTRNSIYNEKVMLENYLVDNAAAIDKLPPAQREALIAYINDEIDKRENFCNQYNGLRNYGLSMSTSAKDSDILDDYYETKTTVNMMNNRLSDMSSMTDLESYAADCGLPAIGG